MKEVQIGEIYKHVEGLTYRVDELISDATGYEESGKVSQSVLYTQLDAGSYPVGTKWVRDSQDFFDNFELV